MPVSAEFLGVSPQACPQPFQAGVRLRSRSSPSDLQRAGRGGEDTAENTWELIVKTWASRDVARATLGLGDRTRSSLLHRPGQDWNGQGAQTSLTTASGESHGVQRSLKRPGSCPRPVLALPSARPCRTTRAPPGLGTNLPQEQRQKGRCPLVKGDGRLGFLASTKVHPTSLQNNPQSVKRSNFFPKKLWIC